MVDSYINLYCLRLEKHFITSKNHRSSSIVSICLILVLVTATLCSVNLVEAPLSYSQQLQKQQVTLTAVLDDQGDPPRLLKMLFEPALKELRARHPDLDIMLDIDRFHILTYIQNFYKQWPIRRLLI